MVKISAPDDSFYFCWGHLELYFTYLKLRNAIKIMFCTGSTFFFFCEMVFQIFPQLIIIFCNICEYITIDKMFKKTMSEVEFGVHFF